MNFTNEDILRIAAEQSAIDCGCSSGDFFGQENVIVPSRVTSGARAYLYQPLDCNFVSYGNNVVACVREELREIVRRYLENRAAERCFETPALHELDGALAPYGVRSRFMAEYFLPDVTRLKEKPCPYPVRILSPEEFQNLYLPEWGNALSAKRPERDVLCAGAYDGDTLAGLAGVSADCETMWQIGIDVLPGYRRKGIASALTSRLALEALSRGKVPFYCAAWSNLKSVRN
ncbi:MAG: GNAT family N-acetyltransferase, partial [Clostridia bacterium]|nr:GNAT family N-acetyltransferase [Clostridia bacterium]